MINNLVIPLDTPSVILYILSGLILIIFFLIIRTETRIRKLLQGKKARTLEESINIQEDLDKLFVSRKKTDKHLEDIEERLKKSIQGVATVRFNPFKGTSGSNQSFSTAFLNEEGNGVILSTIYSRERVSTFAKPIKNYSSEYELTAEEKEAINKASQTKL